MLTSLHEGLFICKTFNLFRSLIGSYEFSVEKFQLIMCIPFIVTLKKLLKMKHIFDFLSNYSDYRAQKTALVEKNYSQL